MPIKLNGATNGSVELDVPAAVGSDLQVTLPATAGTAIVKATDGSVDLGSVDIDSSGDVEIMQGKNLTWVYQSGSTHRARIRAESTDALIFENGSGNTERLRIDSSGSTFFGVTSTPNGTSVGGSAFVAESNNRRTLFLATTAASDGLARFHNSNGQVGTIVVSGTSTAYNTSSDYRLKENVVNIADGITRVKQLSPRRFNFIADVDTTVDGFLAHEAQTVVPESVTGEKDGEEMQGIDQSKLVPLLTAALQEAIAKIETLETKVAALEATP